jgi:hypothetical protein
MNAASVNLKLTPTQFDLVRKALEALRREDEAIFHSTSDAPSEVKKAARAEHVLTTQLIDRLK